MWISVESGKIPDNQLIIDPGKTAELSDRIATMTLSFGVGRRPVTVHGLHRLKDSTRISPIKVLISANLIKQLSIQTEPVYRLKVDQKRRSIEIGPVIGMLLGYRSHWYGQEWLDREEERVTEVYPQTGGLVVAFSPRSMSTKDSCAYGLYWNPLASAWTFGQLPIPSVMHRRSFQTEDQVIQEMCVKTGIRCFNSRRYNKLELYRLLSEDPAFTPHLPETIEVNHSSKVISLVERYRSVILKPAALSRGRGILFISQTRGGLEVMDCRVETAPQWRELPRRSLDRLVQHELAPAFYICQQRIELALIDGKPFDIRVVMQRDTKGEWACNGIECRLAGYGRLVTNIATGGLALSLSEAVRRSFGRKLDPSEVTARVETIAHQLCRVLDKTGESFGEFGIDVALDSDGHEWIIEANVLPTFKGFVTLDYACYQRLLAAPLLYANWLSGFGGEDNLSV